MIERVARVRLCTAPSGVENPEKNLNCELC